MANISGYEIGQKYNYFTVAGAVSTNSTLLTNLMSFMIPGGTFSADNTDTVLRIESGIRKIGTADAATVRFLVNTSNSVLGATQLATYTIDTFELTAYFSRYAAIAAATSTVFATSTTSYTDDLVGVPGSSTNVNIDWTIDQWIILGGFVFTASDTLEPYFLKLGN